MRQASLAALCAALLIVGCGGTSKSSPPRVTQPATLQATPLESARTPEGAKPEAPPVSSSPVTVSEKHIDAAGLRLIEGFENTYKAIYCPEYDEYGRVWDIGFGQTEGIGPDSRCITHAQAEANLRYLVEARYEWALRALGVPFNQHEWDALCSFVWNLGAGIFEGTSVGADLRTRDYYAATRRMLEYDHAGGVVLPGLRTRRETEVRLFLEPMPKPKPVSPSERKRLIVYWTRQRKSVLHRYHDADCKAWSRGPRCTAWRHLEHELYLDIRRLEG
jgi:lysozyme